MKKIALVLVAALAVSSLVGCGKKKQNQDASLDNMANGVVSENVVSVTEQSAVATNGNVPVVVVDNAESLPQAAAESAGASATTDKPTPKQIQEALKAAGAYSGKIDGNIGPKTKKAIEEFQSQHGLKADGKVGPKTWKALSEYLNRASEVANPTAQAQTVGQ